jgi:hypothetical protein
VSTRAKQSDKRLARRTTRELLSVWAAVMRELRRREVVRTANNPISDIAEELVAIHYRGTRGSSSQAGWDVKTSRGEKLQVKAMRRITGNRRTALSPVRSSDYSAVIVVIFDEEFGIESAWRIPRRTVEARFKHSEHVNGRIIRISKQLLGDPSVKRVQLSDELLDRPVAE